MAATDLTEVSGYAFSRTPMSNITPFTYRDGATYLNLLYGLIEFVNEKHIPEINGIITDTERLIDENKTSSEALYNNFVTTASTTIAGWNTLFDEFMADVSARIGAINADVIKSLTVGKGDITTLADDYGVLDKTGAADAYTPLQAALNATPNGGSLTIRPGVYALSQPLVSTGKSVHIKADGVKIVYSGTGAALSLNGSYGQTFYVSGTTKATVAIDGVTTPVMELATTENAPYRPGDTVKIVADNLIPGGRPEALGFGARTGQFATVHSVAGNVVRIIAGDFIDPMTVNVRMAKLNSYTATVTGMTFSVPAGTVDASLSRAIRFADLHKPIARNIDIEQAGAEGVLFVSCYGYLADNVSVGFGNNNPGNNQYGYGVSDCMSSYGVVQNLKARFVRHAFTDSSFDIQAGSPLTSYGRSYGAQVNGVSHGSGGTSFDTHNCSQEMSFLDCVSYDSADNAFNLRGRNHTLRGRAVRPGTGLYVSSENGMDGDSWGHDIDLVVESPRVRAVNFALRKLSNNVEVRPTHIRRLRATNVGAGAFTFTNATVKVSDLTFTVRPDAGTLATNYVIGLRSDLDIRNLRMDFTGLTTTPAGLIAVENRGGVTKFKADRVDVVLGEKTVADKFTWLILGENASSEFRINDMIIDYWTDAKLITQYFLMSLSSYVHHRILEPLGGASNYLYWSSSSNSAMTQALGRSILPEVILAGTIPTDVDLPVLSPGRFIGQKIIVVNLNGVGVITVKNGPTYPIQTATGADLTVSHGQNVTLCWTGSVWQQI